MAILANTFDIIDYESKTLGQCGGRTHNIHVTSMGQNQHFRK